MFDHDVPSDAVILQEVEAIENVQVALLLTMFQKIPTEHFKKEVQEEIQVY